MSGPLNPGFTAEGFMITLAVQAIGALIAFGGALYGIRMDSDALSASPPGFSPSPCAQGEGAGGEGRSAKWD